MKTIAFVGGYAVTEYMAMKFADVYTQYKQFGVNKVINEFMVAVDKGNLSFNLTGDSKNIFIMSSALYLASIVFYYSSRKNYMRGKEHGSSRWLKDYEVNKYKDKKLENNRILANDLYISMNDLETKINNNTLIIGGAGTGKSHYYVRPNLMQLHSSYIITDPKGELHSTTKDMFLKNGYNVKVLNLVNMKESNKYNPFAYIKNDIDVPKMVKFLIKNTNPKGTKTSDPFWEKSEEALLLAICYYIYYELPEFEQNFNTVTKMLTLAKVKEDDAEFESELDLLFKSLEAEDTEHIAVTQYNIFKMGTGKTLKSILISLGVRLSQFYIKDVKTMLETDEMEIDKIGTEKTALFIIIPDTNQTFNFIVGLFYTQMFDRLCYLADHKYNRRLPIQVRCILDEFSNIGEIPNFDDLITTIRSRGISADIIIQNLGQLKNIYKDTYNNIIANCSALLYLGNNDLDTNKFISEKIGKTTIDTKTQSVGKGKGGGSTNYGIQGRELMTADELGRMKHDECVVFINGQFPSKCKKYKPNIHKRFKELTF
jgi:type IV secretion system protein VirD4